LNNLVVISLFILFMILRAVIAGRSQAGGGKKKDKPGPVRLEAPRRQSLPSDEDDQGAFSAYAASQDFPQAVPPSRVERFIPDADQALVKETMVKEPGFPPRESQGLPETGDARFSPQESRRSVPAEPGSPKSAVPLLQRLDYLPSLKQAVVLAEILGPPKGLEAPGL
jgi:hypothetical protein